MRGGVGDDAKFKYKGGWIEDTFVLSPQTPWPFFEAGVYSGGVNDIRHLILFKLRDEGISAFPEFQVHFLFVYGIEAVEPDRFFLVDLQGEELASQVQAGQQEHATQLGVISEGRRFLSVGNRVSVPHPGIVFVAPAGEYSWLVMSVG